MISALLQKCKFVVDRFVPEPGVEPRKVSWKELLSLLCVNGDHRQVVLLRSLRQGSYIGRLKSKEDGSAKLFLMFRQDGSSGSVADIIERDPTLPKRLIDVYQVMSRELGSKITALPPDAAKACIEKATRSGRMAS